MKSAMRKDAFILAILTACCAIAAGNSLHGLDNDELWDLLLKRKLHEIKTNVPSEGTAESVDRTAEAISLRDQSHPGGGDDDGDVIGSIDNNHYGSDLIDADSAMLPDERDELLMLNGNAPTKGILSTGLIPDKDGEVVGDEDPPAPTDPDLVNNDGDAMEGSGQNSLPQGDDPFIFDKEIVSILRNRPESREMLDLLGLSGAKITNDTDNQEVLKEQFRNMLTLPLSKRKNFDHLPTIPEEPEPAEPLAQPASLLADGRFASRMSNVLLPDLNRTLATRRESLLPPKDGQRSLVIVFDATGSMLDDLQQLRDAARLIIAEITQRDNNPIFNYIFVPFRDPHVGPRLVTQNKDELLKALDELQIIGGGDCPEAALEAISSAIEAAMPNSFVYVFTDATAKDFRLDQRVMLLVQKKQTPITFLLTGFCDGKNTPGYQVMNKIAAASNGQVFDLRKDQIEEVLLAIRNTMDIKHVPLKAIDAPQAKHHNIDLNVDSTLREFSVSVAGVKPTIEILDPQHAPYNRTRDVLNLENLRVVNVADPAPGKWNIKATSNSSHSVRLSGLSEVQFKFGFSLLEPHDTVSLSHQPVLNKENYLAIEPSDPQQIKELHSVTIKSHNVGDPGETVFEFTRPLKLVPDTEALYRTDAFLAPRQQFKLTINGENANGEPLQRLLSTAMQAVEQIPPEVTIGYQQRLELIEGDTFMLTCRIQTPFPAVASWRKKGQTLVEKSLEQSNVISLLLANVTTADSGTYHCHAVNDIGNDEKTVPVRVASVYKPSLRILPLHTFAIENEPFIALRCIMEHAEGASAVQWTHNGQPLAMGAGKTYLELEDVNKNHTGNYTCSVNVNGQRVTSSTSTIVVEYGPKIAEPTVTLIKEYDSDVELDCQIDADPVPDFQWYYQPLDQIGEASELESTNRTIGFVMTPQREGLYVCEGKNSYGFGKQTFILEGAANAAPFIIKPQDTTIYVAPGATINLNCSCEYCQPLNEYIWTTRKQTFESSPEDSIDNMRVTLENDQSRNAVRYMLSIDDFQPHNVASYTCILSNQHGADAMILDLRMMVPPEVHAMTLDSELVSSGSKVVKGRGEAQTINCDVVGLPEPTVLWRLDGEAIAPDERFQYENDNKTITFRGPFDEAVQGVYECVASNPMGNASSTLELVFGAAPNAPTPHRKQRVKVGDTVTMDCAIDGTPEPTIRWTPESFTDDATQRQQTLTASYMNAGLYRCTGENQYGTAEHTIQLETYGRPEMKGSLDISLRFGTGDDALLECLGWGIPEPSIHWRFDNAPIKLERNMEVLDRGLRISNITFQQQGFYGCMLENEYGTAQKLYYVTVRDTPKITSSLEPQITLLPNDTVRFECAGTGNPPPQASWLFNGTTLFHDRYIYLSHGNVSIGTYTCLLESTEGTDRHNMFVNILRPPQRISGVNVTDSLTPLKVRAEDPLVLVCPFENFNSLLWQLNERNLEEYFDLTDVRLKENLLIIDHIRSQHEGTYTCVVQNRAGTDRQSFVIGMLTPPVIQRAYPDELGDEYGDPDRHWMPDNPIDSAVEVNLLSGETLQLICQAAGTPEPTIYWNRGTDQVVSQTANLTIRNVALHHSGSYTCVAENDIGRSTQEYRLDVMTAPQNFGEPVQSIEVNAGDNLELDCEMPANPPANYQWLKEDTALDEFNMVLDFNNIDVQDSGVYHCEAENVFGSSKKSFKIMVYHPAEVTAFTPNQTLMKGDSIELDCEAYGNPIPVLSIILRGEVLSSTADLDAPDMVIDQEYRVKNNVYKTQQMYGFAATRFSPYEVRFSLRQPKATLLDKGKYLCMAQNAIGFDERFTKVDVVVAPYVQVDKLKSAEQTIHLLEGLPLFLFCPIDGTPKPTIGWYRNGNRLKHTVNTLFLPSVELRDAGTYVCFGENPVGKTELVFELEVLVPPSIISSLLYGEHYLSADQPDQEEITLRAGDNVTLDCSSLGYPVPEVHWIRIDYLDELRNELLPMKTPLMEVHHVQDTATYSCFVNNTVGSAQKLFHLVVQAAPSWKSGLVYAYEHRASLHHSLDLTCETDGSPEAIVTWMKDGRQLGKNEEGFYFGVNGRTLRLLAARLDDAGSYQCVAMNMLGQISREFHVAIDVPVSWSPWGSWSACSSTCGSGTQFRSRICLLLNGSPAHGDRFNCVGENVEIKSCELLPCPVNGAWGEWTAWSNCTLACVTEYSNVRSVRHRSRNCDSPAPSLGGKPCIGEDYEEEPCRVQYCPVDGSWTAWSDWTTCSEACGFGRSLRWRSCSNPVPRHGGRPCEGPESEVKTCKLRDCHLDGGWSEWTAWSQCSKSCGEGIKLRKRFCNNPKPRAGGKPCVGENVEHTRCMTKPCRNDGLLRSMQHPRKPLTPLITYDTNIVRSANRETFGSNDLSSDDYEDAEMDHDRGASAGRRYQFAQGSPVEYVDVPETPPSSADTLRITVKMTNTVQLSNDTTDFSLNFGNPTLSSPTLMTCTEGFAFNATAGGCSDVDECREGSCSGPQQVCTNTVGGYECDCTPGYRASFHQTDWYGDVVMQDMQCLDINECREQTHECSHYCSNTPGSYQCYCPERYLLTKDGKTCTIKQKRNEPVRKVPRCMEGFQWEGGRCQDTDECALHMDECGDALSCINTRGGYICVDRQCPPEYEQDSEGTSCALNCTLSGPLCTDGALLGQMKWHIIVTIDRFNPQHSLAVVSIPVPQRSGDFDTKFSFRDRRYSHIFSLGTISKTSGAVRLYANRKLQRGRLYKLNLIANTFRWRRLEYVHDFVIHVYWND